LDKEYGKLYLIPATIGNPDPGRTIPGYNLNTIKQISSFIAENISTSRRFLRKSGYTKDFNEVSFYTLDKHTTASELETYLQDCQNGENMGLMSESGIPCIADPGSLIVSMAHRKGIQVVPLSGPSSLLLALMASGFNGQNFAFIGYLPVEADHLVRKIREIEKIACTQDQTQIFIEAPYRNNRLAGFLLKECKPSTLLCIACELSMDTEQVISKSINDWKTTKFDFNKKNCVFLIYH